MHGTLKNEMLVMDPTGHTKIEWDHNSPDEVEIARAAFQDAVGRNYSAFKVDRKGERGERVTVFDPAAEKYIMVAQLRGG
jgi:hypothetical protein